MRPRPLLFACLLALGLTACGADEPPAPASKPYKDPGLYAGTTLERGGLKLPARIQGRDLALAHRGRFAARFWPGVNLGVTVPGRSPGELAPTRRDYDRWLDGMQDLGARVVRVYTILRPAFYDALAAHNRRNSDTPMQLGFDVRPGGNKGLPGRPGVDPEADVAISLGPGRKAVLHEAASTDPIGFLYGLARPYVPVKAADLEPGSGAWVRPKLMLNRPYTVPRTGEKRPAELLDISALRWGTADPKARTFDDRVTVAGGGKTVELRIPWAMLTFSDPSSRRVWVPKADGSVGTLKVGRLGIDVAPAGAAAVSTNGYGWDEWNRVDFHERRKAGWPAVQRSMRSSATSPR